MEESQPWKVRVGGHFFRMRDYTPVPLIILIMFFARPSVTSATLGLTAVIAGELFRLYSVAFIGAISRTRKNHTGAKLITSGPFAYCRNPLYVGNFFISTGVAIFSGEWFLIGLTAALFALQYYFIASYEEAILEDQFGDEYHQYRKEVPAWLPKEAPKLEEIEWPETFSPAIRSEKSTFLAITLILGILLVLS